MDLAQLTNTPREVAVAGKPYKVSALKLKEWGNVQAWIKDNVPSPLGSLKSADLDGLSSADKRTLLDVAVRQQRDWPPRVGSAAWFEALDHDGGHAMFLLAILGKHQPDFSESDAEALAERLTNAEILPLVLLGLGIEDDRPKNSSAPQGAQPTTTSPSPTSPTTSASSSTT